jgi:YVTN family beta-propeller protein
MKAYSNYRTTMIVGLSVLILAGMLDGARADGFGSRRDQYKEPEDDHYKSPIQMRSSTDGRRLYVTCENSSELLVIDTGTRKVVGHVPVGRKPYDVVLSPDEKTIYVSNRWDDNISVIDADRVEVVRTVPVGDDPHALLFDPSGDFLFVTNTSTENVSVIATASHEEVKSLPAGTFPFEMARSPDGGSIYVTNLLSNPVALRTPPVSEVTVINMPEQLVLERRLIPSVIIMQEIVFSPDGKLVLAVGQNQKNLLPLTQIAQGWSATFGLAVMEARPRGRHAFILIDDVNQYYADPYAIVISPDGRYAYVSSSAVDVVSVIDMKKVAEVLDIQDGRIGLSEEELAVCSRSLGLSSEFVVARMPVGKNPKGLSLSPDGSVLYVANRLSDSISIIDTKRREIVGTIDLGGPAKITTLRYGEQLFNYSSISFQEQLSCNTCHPEQHKDALAYDIAIDGGMGHNLVLNRTLRGIAGTEPFKWSGKNPDLKRQDGPRAAQLIFRTHGFEPDELDAIVKYIESIPFPPNRYRIAGGGLNDTQRGGKQLYERAYTNDGRYIPVSNRCVTCHPPPFYTNGTKYNVGSRAHFDTDTGFDPPQLANVYEQIAFMHDGRCYTLEEIWTIFNPDDLHGQTNDLTKLQLNDLIEYIKTLGTPPEDYEKDLGPYSGQRKIGPKLAIGDIETFTVPEARYVGNDVCRVCHEQAYRVWANSRHARAWMGLAAGAAKPIAEKDGIGTKSPTLSAKCLACHSTAAAVAEGHRAPGLRIEDGVQCEACHGPGETHSLEEGMPDREATRTANLKMPDETHCLGCHRPEPSHAELNLKPFSFAERWKKIGHSRDMDERASTK